MKLKSMAEHRFTCAISCRHLFIFLPTSNHHRCDANHLSLAIVTNRVQTITSFLAIVYYH